MPKQKLEGVLQNLRSVLINPAARDLTDAKLLQRFLVQREETAFALLVQRHGAMVQSVCRRVLGDVHGAEDSVQATFIVLIRRAASLRFTGSLASWLYGVAQRIALKARRQRAARYRRERALVDSPGPESHDALDWQELRTVFDEEIGRLAQKYRAPIVLCYFEDKSYDQAARELGWSKSSLAKRLTRARELLRQQLVRRGLALSAAALASALCEKASAAPLGALLTLKAVKAALSVAPGNAMTPVGISARALALADETMTAGTVIKAKAVVFVVALGLALGGAGWSVYRALAQPTQATTALAPADKQQAGGSPKKERTGTTAPKAAAAPVDAHGDPLPFGAISRLGSNPMGHGRDVAFSPDGRIVASVAYNHQVCLWDVVTAKKVGQLTSEDSGNPYTNSRWLYCIAFSPDGKQVACGAYEPSWPARTIRIWEVATGKLLNKIEGHKGGVLAVAYSPDGRVLASASADQSVALWDAVTCQELRRLIGHSAAVRSVAFSPDGKTLASGADEGSIRLWEVATGRELRKLLGHQAAVQSVCFSPDGQSLASGSGDQTVRLWEPATGKVLAVLRGHRKAVMRVCFAPDGKTVASASKDQTVQLWDVAGGTQVGLLKADRGELSGLSYSPNGKILAAAGAGLTLWDLASGKNDHPRTGHKEAVPWLRFLEGRSTLASLSRDNTLRWWDWKSGKELRQIRLPKMPLRGAAHPISGIAFGPGGGPLALSSPQGGMYLLDPTSGDELGRLMESNGPIMSASFSPDGKVLASTDKQLVQLWDIATRKVLVKLPEDPSGTKLVLFAPDGKLLLGGNRTSRLWDVAGNKLVRQLPLACANMWSVVFTPDSQMLLCGDTEGQVQMWDLEKGSKVRVFKVSPGYVQAMAISPDRRLLAAGSWGTVVLEIETGQQRFSVPGSSVGLAFTSDGRNLATGDWNGPILIWDIPSKALAADLKLGDDQQALQALWTDLADVDGAKVHSAIWGLVGRQAKAAAYLRTLLKPVPAVDGRHMAQLTKDLDSDLFRVRERATKELEKLGELAEPALKKLLVDSPSLEVKLRAEGLLKRISPEFTSPARMQVVRAIEALEYMGTPQARDLLRQLSHGASGVRVTREAAASLKRLATQK